jgi:uncharacterized protein
MRVIITGGTGLIGRLLVADLVQDGHEVIVLTRNVQDKHDVFAPAVRLVQWDALSPEGWGHLITSDTAIINLAGENVANWRWTLTHRRIVLQSRLAAGRAVTQAIAQAEEKPAVLLQASAVGYYGSRGDLSLGEITTPGTGWRAEVCKLWEAETDPVLTQGVRRVLLRIGIVIDPAGGALPPMVLGTTFMGRRLGDGKQWVPWIHNADVSGAIRFLMTAESLDGPVNICAPYPVTNADLMASIGRVRRWPTLIPVPAFALWLALGEMATSVLDSQRVYPSVLQSAGYDFQFPQITPALRALLKRG